MKEGTEDIKLRDRGDRDHCDAQDSASRHMFNKSYCQVRSSKTAQLCKGCGFSVRETDHLPFLCYCIESKKEEVSEHSLSLISVLIFLSLICCLEQPVGCTT